MEYLEIILNNVVFVVLEGATLLYLFLYFTNEIGFLSTNWLKCLIYLLLYFLISQFFIHYRNMPLPLVYVAFNILVLSYLTKTNLFVSIITNVIAFLIYGVTEIIVTTPILYFLGISSKEVLNDNMLLMKALILTRPIQTIAIYGLTRIPIKNSLLKESIFRKDNSSTSYLLLVLFFMGAFYAYMIKYIDNIYVLGISLVLFMVVTILGIFDTKERIKLMHIENQLELQKKYSRNMELIVDAVRKEKHDYRNHISTLIALCTMKDPDALNKIREYALKLTNNENTSGFHFYNTGNKYLDGLLAVKNSEANAKEIFFEVDVETTLKDIQVDDVDLTTIVGNIIDNAFEAVVMNPPERKKIVSLLIYRENNKCIIAIANNGEEIHEVHKKHIFEYKYSTKSKAEGERGYGLFIVRELIVRNNGFIDYHSNEFETEFRISFNYKNNKTSAFIS
ncbi:MAG: GHKL domain-containing protein [Clostridiales bacterium]|nr:GHKL domain-containing protein [Clostridiales bacterium]